MNPLLTKTQLISAVLIGLAMFQSAHGQRQKPVRPGNDPNPASQPRASDSIPPPPKRKKGDLLLSGAPRIPGVEVILTREGKPGAVIKELTNQNGSAYFQSLEQGKYEVQIVHEDYEPFHQTVFIRSSNKPLDLPIKMLSRFGDLTLLFQQPTKPGPDVHVFLDGSLIPPDELQYKQSEIVIPRTPVGLHKIQVVKSGYEEWGPIEYEVAPGNVKQSLLPIDLKPATVSLTVKTNAGARVYLAKERNVAEDKGQIPVEGKLLISGLSPGVYTVRVSLEGYEDAPRTIPLTLKQRNELVEIELEHSTETTDGSASFDSAINEWFPGRPATWKVDDRKGILINGDQPAFFAGPRKEGHDYGYYGDFVMTLRLRMTNGKGASWIVRGKDENNYYRFDLARGKNAEPFVLDFFACRNGQRGTACQKLDSYDVMIQPQKPEDVLTIELTATGHRFKHRFAQTNNPQEGYTEFGVGVFSDESFKVGGVGLCAMNGAEFYVLQFSVEPPLKK